jgi:hypothetical protein
VVGATFSRIYDCFFDSFNIVDTNAEPNVWNDVICVFLVELLDEDL